MPNALCHFELMTNDPGKAKGFYERVFNWKFDEKSMPGYILINTGAEPSGGMFGKPNGAQDVCHNIYFQVNDIEATLKNVTDAGGKVLVPKTPIPGVGHFAMFADPDGLAVGIMKSTG